MNAMSKDVVAAEPRERGRAEAQPKRRRLLRRTLMLAVPVALAVAGILVWLAGGRFETTENASLQSPLLSISAEVAGRVVEVDAEDGEAVSAGDVLFRVDPAPYRIALAQAEAALASARLGVDQLKAEYGAAVANAKSAADDVSYYEEEYERQKSLRDRGVVPASALDAAERNLHNAEEARVSADQAVARALAALGGDADAPADAHPTVLAAEAAREKAAYDLARTTVTAPASGIIARADSFRPGQFVQPGVALFALMESSDAWVEANFKETQLTNFAVGQPATVEFDTLPGREFTAHVASIGAGTGSEFSLLPAQNATGNWVKVTQRIPVRLRLDTPPEGLAVSGMSATVTVDTGASRHLPGLSAWASE